MKKNLIYLLIISAIFLTFITTQVSAKVLTSPNANVYVGANETIDDDLFVGGQTVKIDGIINGDVYIGAQTVKITGTINGSLYMGANTIYLGGRVKGNVYAGGQNILVDGGLVDGSLLAGGASIDIDKNSSIGGSVLTGAGSVAIDSLVKRNVFAAAGSLTIGNNANIGKDLYYATSDATRSVDISKAAKISGAVRKTEMKTPKKEIVSIKQENLAKAISGFKVFSTIISFISALIVGYIYLRFFGNDFTKTSEIVEKSFWKCMGVGFLLTIGLIPGLVILLMTVIGIPLAGLVLLLFALYVYLSQVVVGRVFGNWLVKKFRWKPSVYITYAIGLGGIYILKMVPVLGFVTDLVVLWLGVGVYARYFFTSKHT